MRADDPKRSGIISEEHSVTVTSGPLPPPDVLGLHDQISPGLAVVIVDSFKSEYQQRHHMETLAMNADIEAMRLQASEVARGQWLGFVIAVFGLTAGAVLIYFQHDIAGATLGAGGLASVLAAYFRSNKNSVISK